MTHQNKTIATNQSVSAFVNRVADEILRKDSLKLIHIMTTTTGHKPKLWGPSIIGFDTYHYCYDSGREGDMCVIGFSPRKSELAIYFVDGLNNYKEELQQLGKHRAGKSCLYIKRLTDINLSVLETMLEKSYTYTKSRDGNMHRAR